jgi:hypothetical protein
VTRQSQVDIVIWLFLGIRFNSFMLIQQCRSKIFVWFTSRSNRNKDIRGTSTHYLTNEPNVTGKIRVEGIPLKKQTSFAFKKQSNLTLRVYSFGCLSDFGFMVLALLRPRRKWAAFRGRFWQQKRDGSIKRVDNN